MRRDGERIAAVIVVAVVVAVAMSTARADDDDDAAKASELFERGRHHVKQANHAEACPLFEASLTLVPALGTELNLALCWIEIGRLVDAMRMLEALIPKTVEAGQAQREALARDGLAAVSARIPRVRIDASALPAATKVQIDDDVVADLGEPIAVDPGDHVITADGAESAIVTAVEGDIASVVLRPSRERAADDTAAIAIAPDDRRHRDRRLMWYAAGGAAGFVVIGTITGGIVLAQRGAALDRCDRDPGGDLICDPRGIELLDRARTMSHVTTVMFVAGAALSATAVVLYYRGKRADRAIASAWLTPTTLGVAVERSW